MMHQTNYVLAIAAGNAHVIFGVYVNGRCVGRWRADTQKYRSADDYADFLFNAFKYVDMDASSIAGAVMSCNGCGVQETLTQMCVRHFNCTPLVVGAGVRTGLAINDGRAEDLSPQRLANIVGLAQGYKVPAIVVDCGDITTFDVLDGDGKYMGGVIAPGIMTSLQVLPTLAPQLPHVDFGYSHKALGINAKESMQIGHYWAAIDMISAMVKRIWESLGIEGGKVVGTGEYIQHIADSCACIDSVDTHLIFSGLREIYTLNEPVGEEDNWQARTVQVTNMAEKTEFTQESAS